MAWLQVLQRRDLHRVRDQINTDLASAPGIVLHAVYRQAYAVNGNRPFVCQVFRQVRGHINAQVP